MPSDWSSEVFSGGALREDEAHARFDRMLANAGELPFAKQPVIERSSGRLVSEARGKGYATEASRDVLAKAPATVRDDIVAIIDPVNQASQNVARKLGFDYWKWAAIDDCVRKLYRLRAR